MVPFFIALAVVLGMLVAVSQFHLYRALWRLWLGAPGYEWVAQVRKESSRAAWATLRGRRGVAAAIAMWSGILVVWVPAGWLVYLIVTGTHLP